jgi:hypothetical protein
VDSLYSACSGYWALWIHFPHPNIIISVFLLESFVMSEMDADLSKDLSTFEEHLHKRLHPDLAAAVRERQLIEEQIKEYTDLDRQLNFLREVLIVHVCPS